MRIKIGYVPGEFENRKLVIEAEGPASEDKIIENWHNQIISHLRKLEIKIKDET